MKRSIVSRKGDKGETFLYGGVRVDKDSREIEFLGSIDELNSCLGLVKAQAKQKSLKDDIESIQKDLSLILSCRINKENIKRIDGLIKKLEPELGLEKEFYLPGKNLGSAYLDFARAIARKAERRAVGLCKKKALKNPDIIIYLNRLSDLLFLLARSSEIN